ncbi:MAG: hypothetical protein L0H64_22730 [Pseudonocardia sp.]|nr:hypothetical protein [Pseudonocardia sp.]
MNADTGGARPVFPGPTAIPAQRTGSRAVPSPRDIPAQRIRPAVLRRLSAPVAEGLVAEGPAATDGSAATEGPVAEGPAATEGPVAEGPAATDGSAATEVQGIRDHARSEVLHRHARLTTGGRPVFCTPSRAEIAGVVSLRQGRGTDGKVIYDTRETAEAAARELETLGARALRSYVCGRSRSGHFHLATDTAHRPLTPAEVHARIPRQRGRISA